MVSKSRYRDASRRLRTTALDYPVWSLVGKGGGVRLVLTDLFDRASWKRPIFSNALERGSFWRIRGCLTSFTRLWWFGLRFEPIPGIDWATLNMLFAIKMAKSDMSHPKYAVCDQNGQKWHENNHLSTFTRVQSKFQIWVWVRNIIQAFYISSLFPTPTLRSSIAKIISKAWDWNSTKVGGLNGPEIFWKRCTQQQCRRAQWLPVSGHDVLKNWLNWPDFP